MTENIWYKMEEANFKKSWALWWLDVFLALFTCFYLPFVMYVPPQYFLSFLANLSTDQSLPACTSMRPPYQR